MSSFIFQVLDVEPEWTVTYEEVLDYLKGAYSKMVSTLKYDHLSCIQSVRVTILRRYVASTINIITILDEDTVYLY